LADEFVQRHRRGEQPSLTEYAQRNPELAERIRDLFPALLMMEGVRPGLSTVIGGDTGPAGAGLPERLGEYRILREIGRGGMGVVYEAEQESLGRRVALKVLPPGALGDALHIERFRREARAAARLHHTNIVPVFAVGVEGETYYYVMQYIEGHPLDQVLAELPRLRDADGHDMVEPTEEMAPPNASAPHSAVLSSVEVARSLWQGRFRTMREPDSAVATEPEATAPPARAGDSTAAPRANSSGPLSDRQGSFAKSVAHLGVQVAEALEYASGQGVLHRDVKPSNLLLDVWGTVWLTDFGLAKASGTPDLTRPGDLLGTLRYLAPERFHGRADVRSDVYSLGLTLYEVLALRPAFDGRDQAELARQITATEPRRLDRIDPRLPRDLVTIVHKAMAKDPGDRYQTAGALGDDLRRFLDDRAIVARRATLAERAWRLCRRHPLTTALMVALLAVLFFAIGRELWVERQRQERRAEAAWRQAMARQAVEAALERADPRRVQGRWQEANAVLAQAEGRLDEAASEELQQRLNQMRADLDLATHLDRIRMDRAAFVAGDFATDRAERDYASEFAKAGLAVTSNETAEHIRRSSIREQLVAALDDWALATSNGPLRWWLMRLASAADTDPQWRDRMPGPLVWDKHVERAALERLVAEAPLAKLSPPLLTLLGVRLRRAGADPERFLRTAQRLHPADFWLNYDLGMALFRKAQPAEAAGFFRAALVARPDCSHVYNKLGLTLIKLEKSEEGVAAYRRAIEFDPENANAHYNLADALSDQGRTEEAVAEYRRAIVADPPSAMYSHNKLAVVLHAKGQVKEAMAEFRRAIASDPKASMPHHNLGILLATQGQFKDAVAEYRRAITLDPRASGPHLGLGSCLQTEGQLNRAIEEYRRAIELDPSGASAHFHLGAALQTRGDADGAIAHLRKAVQIDPRQAPAHEALAATLLRRGHFAEARAAAQRGLELFPGNEPRRPAMQKTLEQCDHMLALDMRLPALLQAPACPEHAGERLAQARLYSDYGRPGAAARLYAAAFAAQPPLAEALDGRNRLDAACAAVRAAADPGGDEAQLGETERAALRRQALGWLRADLELRTKPRQSSKSARDVLKTWKTEAALASVRDQAALAKMPAEEHEKWRRLWAELDALLPEDPLEQGQAHIRHREWEQAADCYTRALKLTATHDGHFWFEYAAVLLLSGDRQGYRKTCARIVERGVQAPELRAYHVARACTLAPDTVANARFPGRLVAKELAAHSQDFWSLTEQGALHFRAGRFKEAVPLLEQSLQADPLSGRAVLNWLWLALAEQRLGKPDEARLWLAKAQTWLDQYSGEMPSRAEQELGLHLHNWLEAHILRREAEALLDTGPTKPQ
jgi:tetratricopeptide (TPR) repeat protein